MNNILFSQVFNVNTFCLIFMYFQIIFLCIKKIFYFFIINFTHWYFHWELYIFTWTFNPVKNSSYHSRNNTLIFNVCNIWTHHCECFSRWCLAVCKYSTVESFKDRINYWSSCYIIDFYLFWPHIKNLIIDEFIFTIITWLFIRHVNHNILFILIEF